jgi:hypothetical protein
MPATHRNMPGFHPIHSLRSWLALFRPTFFRLTYLWYSFLEVFILQAHILQAYIPAGGASFLAEAHPLAAHSWKSRQLSVLSNCLLRQPEAGRAPATEVPLLPPSTLPSGGRQDPGYRSPAFAPFNIAIRKPAGPRLQKSRFCLLQHCQPEAGRTPATEVPLLPPSTLPSGSRQGPGSRSPAFASFNIASRRPAGPKPSGQGPHPIHSLRSWIPPAHIAAGGMGFGPSPSPGHNIRPRVLLGSIDTQVVTEHPVDECQGSIPVHSIARTKFNLSILIDALHHTLTTDSSQNHVDLADSDSYNQLLHSTLCESTIVRSPENQIDLTDDDSRN